MAKIDFKSLSPEEVAALSGKDKANYEKWLAKQSDNDPNNDNDEPEAENAAPSSVELVKVKALKQVNTSAHGYLYPGAKEPYSIGKELANQLAALGEVKIVN